MNTSSWLFNFSHGRVKTKVKSSIREVLDFRKFRDGSNIDDTFMKFDGVVLNLHMANKTLSRTHAPCLSLPSATISQDAWIYQARKPNVNAAFVLSSGSWNSTRCGMSLSVSVWFRMGSEMQTSQSSRLK